MKLTKEELEELRRADEEIDRDFAEAFPVYDGLDQKLDIDALADRVGLCPVPERAEQPTYYYRNHAKVAAKSSVRYRKHREQRIAYSNKYYAEHKDHRKLRYLANKEAALEYYHRYYAANKEKILAKEAEYRAAHRDEIRAKAKEKREALRLAQNGTEE